MALFAADVGLIRRCATSTAGWRRVGETHKCKPKEGQWKDGVSKLVPRQAVLIGRCRTNPSHHLAAYPHRGLTAICCLNCGAYPHSRTTLKYLKKPCQNAGGASASRAGAEILRQFEKRRNLRTGKQGDALLRNASHSRRSAEHLSSGALAKKRKTGHEAILQVNRVYHTVARRPAPPYKLLSRQPSILRRARWQRRLLRLLLCAD